jgi:hypothetical protein
MIEAAEQGRHIADGGRQGIFWGREPPELASELAGGS